MIGAARFHDEGILVQGTVAVHPPEQDHAARSRTHNRAVPLKLDDTRRAVQPAPPGGASGGAGRLRPVLLQRLHVPLQQDGTDLYL